MIANIHHHIQAMLLVDNPLNENERNSIEQHLVTCTDCRIFANLVERLEEGQWSPYHKRSLSAGEKAQIANTFQCHLRRHTMRNTNPLSLLGWASLILILVITLGWAVNTLIPKLPLSVILTSATPFTQSTMSTGTPFPQNSTDTPLPQDTLESNNLGYTPTPDVGNAADFTFVRGYQNRTDTVLVDLNCDGQNEQLLTAYRVSTNPLEEDSEVRDYLGVALKVPDENGGYRTAWTYTFDHSSEYGLYHVELFPLDGCEQLLGVDGQRVQGNVGVHSLQIFRWDGNEMLTIFDVPEGLMVSSEDEVPTAEGFSITTFTYGFPDPIKHTCDWTYRQYTWDGETFILVDEWQQQNQPCGGHGG